MPISVRTRFEVIKRDGFTCQYCGRRSPDVVLEVDHIVPVASGGVDDLMNLTTSCWECNRGKSDRPLGECMTGEDPHDRAILLLERERQLREYNAVLAAINERVEEAYGSLSDFWLSATGQAYLKPADQTWLVNTLHRVPAESVYRAMRVAISNHKTRGFAYVNAVIKTSEAAAHGDR